MPSWKTMMEITEIREDTSRKTVTAAMERTGENMREE
jgi:hypothetical protein